MKKKIFGAIAIFAIAAVAAFNVSLNMNENEMSQLSLANVEALAQDTESDTAEYYCRGNTGTCAAGSGWEIKGESSTTPCN